jgi:prophage antirepressor-like protein
MNTQLNPLANPFQFDTTDIRTATDENGEVWFCAKDVCAVLDISWSSMTLENMPENWVMVINLITIKGEREAKFINEAGIYRLIFRSNKPNAEAFANFICEEVLPAIRKNGFYGTIDLKTRLALGKEINSLVNQIVTSKNVFELKMLIPQLRNYCNIAGLKIPDLQLIKADIEQTDLFLAGAK